MTKICVTVPDHLMTKITRLRHKTPVLKNSQILVQLAQVGAANNDINTLNLCLDDMNADISKLKLVLEHIEDLIRATLKQQIMLANLMTVFDHLNHTDSYQKSLDQITDVFDEIQQAESTNNY